MSIMHLIFPKTRDGDAKMLQKQYSKRYEWRTQNVVYHRLEIQKRIGLVSLASTLPLIRLAFIVYSHKFVHDALKERRASILLHRRKNLPRHLLQWSVGSLISWKESAVVWIANCSKPTKLCFAGKRVNHRLMEEAPPSKLRLSNGDFRKKS